MHFQCRFANCWFCFTILILTQFWCQHAILVSASFWCQHAILVSASFWCQHAILVSASFWCQHAILVSASFWCLHAILVPKSLSWWCEPPFSIVSCTNLDPHSWTSLAHEFLQGMDSSFQRRLGDEIADIISRILRDCQQGLFDENVQDSILFRLVLGSRFDVNTPWTFGRRTAGRMCRVEQHIWWIFGSTRTVPNSVEGAIPRSKNQGQQAQGRSSGTGSAETLRNFRRLFTPYNDSSSSTDTSNRGARRRNYHQPKKREVTWTHDFMCLGRPGRERG